MRIQYASTITPASPTLSSIGGAVSAKAGTWYVWLYCRNRAGFTLFSTVQSLAVTTGLRIVIASAVRPTGASIHEIGVAIASTNTPAAAAIVATYPGDASLPAQIDLIRDEHFETNKTVANLAAFPTGADLIHGMRRDVSSEGKIYAYDAINLEWVISKDQTFQPYVSSTIAPGDFGADRDINSFTFFEDIIFNDYAVDGSYSDPVDYWIVNDTGVPIIQGTRIRVAAAADIADISAEDLKGLLNISVLGYVNLSTGVLDNSTAIGEIPYQGELLTNLLLLANLPNNYACAVRVRANFNPFDVNNRVAQGEIIKIYPRLATDYSSYDSSWDSWGDRIIADGGRCRILPNGTGLSLIKKDGSGSVKHFSFLKLGEQIVPGLDLNTADQDVVITNNGVAFVSTTIPDTAALRAIVGTVDGVGQISAWTGSLDLDTGKIIQVEIENPIAIRNNYPDVVAETVATLNANKVRVYVRPVGGGTIEYFDAAIVGDATEIVLIGSGGGVIVGSLPTVVSDFGLFDFIGFTPTAIAGSSSFGTATYEIAIAYLYENTVTTISHDTDRGCIFELSGTASDLFEVAESWGKAITSITLLREVSQSKTYAQQTRRVNGKLYYFEFSSYDIDDGVTTIKPSWRTNIQAGRWILEGSRGVNALLVQSFEPTGTTQTIDWNKGAYVILDLSSATGNVTLTLQNPVPGTYILEIRQWATARNLIFPAGTIQSGEGGNIVIGVAEKVNIGAIAWNGVKYLISVGTTSYA